MACVYIHESALPSPSLSPLQYSLRPATLVSQDSKLRSLNSGNLPGSGCVPPPGATWNLPRQGVGAIVRLTSLVSRISGIPVLCCLKPHAIKSIVSYILYGLLLVSSRRVNLNPFTPSWPEVEFRLSLSS